MGSLQARAFLFLGLGLTLVPCPLNVAALAQGFSFFAQSETTEKVFLQTNEEKEIVLSWLNSGSSQWLATGPNPLKVGTSAPRDRPSVFHHGSWLSSNRLAPLIQTVAPGEKASFKVTIKAPGKVGVYQEKLELVAEYLAWIPGSLKILSIEVVPGGSHYRILNQAANPKLIAGGRANLWLELQNVGTTTWSGGGENPVKLGTSRPPDRKSVFRDESWLSDNRVMVLSPAEVRPGEKVKFEFLVKAPLKHGVYKEEFNLVAEYLTWFPAQGIIWQIEVGPAIYRGRLKDKSPPLVLKPGEQGAAFLELENIGNVPWEKGGSYPVRLGTASPLDRRSVFEDGSWITPNRPASLEQEKVLPLEVGRFEFVLRAPDKIGSYREAFRPVAEYAAWMNDLNLIWEIKVEEELVLKNPIRVGLTNVASSLSIESTGGLVIRDRTNNLVARVNAGGVRITPQAAFRVEAEGKVVDVSGLVKVTPLNHSLLKVSDPGVSSTYNTFRGILRLERSQLSGRAWIINDLELEDYLKGVAEMPPSWPPEALKAQAVLARTWAVRARSGPIADIFDLYDDARSQVYYGYNYEGINPALTQAVEATRGVVVKYGGNYAATYYHSDSGGYTENVENVWAGGDETRAVPYLVAVPDPYAKPVTWEATINQDYLNQRFEEEFKKAGVYLQPVVDTTVAERYPSGRAKKVIFSFASGQQVVLTGRRFDYLTHNTIIKSMIFEIRKDAETSAPNFIFTGKGNGHGVGLSQWSAYNMANQGKSFEEMIRFFYSGTTLVNE